jgi:pyruvate dehydrogenase E2 component (dihydrolipoamide acetyltransferase)
MATSIYPITMPKWGIEMTEGTITGWHATPGASVGKGDALLDVETEKIVNAVESPVAGTLRRILADQGEVRPVGSLIAVFADASVTDADLDAFVRDFKGAVVNFEPDAGSAPAAVSRSNSPAPTAESADGESRVSPIARRLAERLGIDISRVKGTGRNGRISKEDVEAYAATMGARSEPNATSAANTPTRVAMSSMRATIARRLLESAQGIPAFRTSIDVDMGALLVRKTQLADSGVKVTITDLIVRALGLALVEHPLVNAQLEGNEILQFSHADIAVAVATEGGLVTPIVRGADTKPVADIAAATRDLAARAKSGGLQREEISGGTFTLSNLGMFGIAAFDAIINPPQVAILAVAATETRAVVRNGQLAVAQLCTMTMTADHRVVDGAVAAAFLTTLRRHIEGAAAL